MSEDEKVTALLARLPGLERDGHLTADDARAIRHLAARPKAARTARCPVCVVPEIFRAATDEELLAAVANHTMRVHNGGSVDAFNTAELAVPSVGIAYRKDARERPWLYR